eukprot:Sdes_comp19389_c0_seq2m10689
MTKVSINHAANSSVLDFQTAPLSNTEHAFSGLIYVIISFLFCLGFCVLVFIYKRKMLFEKMKFSSLEKQPLCVETSEQLNSYSGVNKSSRDSGVMGSFSQISSFWFGSKSESPSACDSLEDSLGENYILKERLGSGRFATVRKCINKSSGKPYAAKIFSKKNSSCPHTRKQACNEMEILSTLSHPNIVRFYEMYESNVEIVLIVDLAPGGDLFEHLDISKGIPEPEGLGIISQILCAVQYLHSSNIIHRDLKPENVFFDACKKNIVLGDFGFSRRLNENSDIRELCGTAEFIPPEILSGEAWSKACDMWAVGVMIYNIFSGLSPFLGSCTAETYSNIALGVYSYPISGFSEISDESKQLIDNLLVLSPSSRSTATECLQLDIFIPYVNAHFPSGIELSLCHPACSAYFARAG